VDLKDSVGMKEFKGRGFVYPADPNFPPNGSMLSGLCLPREREDFRHLQELLENEIKRFGPLLRGKDGRLLRPIQIPEPAHTARKSRSEVALPKVRSRNKGLRRKGNKGHRNQERRSNLVSGPHKQTQKPRSTISLPALNAR
jgi:hypothetical protein